MADSEPPRFIFDTWVNPKARPKPKPAVNHFGENIRPGKYGHRLTRDVYALPNKRSSHYENRVREWFTDDQWAADAWVYEDDAHTRYSDEYVEYQRERALRNFDLNMAFFARLDPQVLQGALDDMLRARKRMRPIVNLADFEEVEGVYVMVFDQYNSAYVGTSSNIRNRIKQHWRGMHEFDRLLDGPTNESVIAVDCFRALDTTRLFALKTSRASEVEFDIERAFPPDYLLNRHPGGVPSGGFEFLVQSLAKKRRVLDASGQADDAAQGRVEQ